MKIFKLCSIVLLIATLSASYGQDLKRRAFFGTRIIELNDSIVRDYKLEKNKGVLIQKIIPNRTASNLKLLKNDVIVKINDVDIIDNNSFYSVITTLRAGDNITVDYIRNTKLNKTDGKAVEKPRETSDDYEVIYDEVKYNDGYMRTIITKPKGIEKAPAILFIPGYMCYSLDNIGMHPYGQLIAGLTKKGYVVMRAEKLGEGDCWNTPNCPDMDFITELAGFEKGLQSLKKYDFVDQDNIFIWGHSLGAMEAPLLAERNIVKGIIINGTELYSWYEYLLKMFRFQEPLLGRDYLEIEEMMKAYKRFQYEFLVLKKTPLELSKNEEYSEILKEQQFDGKDKILGRNYKYWQQIEDINQTKAFKNSEAYVLSIWNSADIEAFSEQEHKTIIDIVNYYHPGKGTYVKLENTTHAFAKVESIKQGLENQTNYDFIISNFNPKIVEVTHNWIQSVLKNECQEYEPTYFSKAEILEDMSFLKEKVKNIHPKFIDKEFTKQWNGQYASIVDNVPDSMSFNGCCMKYASLLSMLQDGHSNFSFPYTERMKYMKGGGVTMPLTIKIKRNKIFIAEYFTKPNQTNIVGSEIISINGISSDSILKRLYLFHGAKKISMINYNIEKYFGAYFWTAFGEFLQYDIEIANNEGILLLRLNPITNSEYFTLKNKLYPKLEDKKYELLFFDNNNFAFINE